jgi:hypothetical protein
MYCLCETTPWAMWSNASSYECYNLIFAFVYKEIFRTTLQTSIKSYGRGVPPRHNFLVFSLNCYTSGEWFFLLSQPTDRSSDTPTNNAILCTCSRVLACSRWWHHPVSTTRSSVGLLQDWTGPRSTGNFQVVFKMSCIFLRKSASINRVQAVLYMTNMELQQIFNMSCVFLN